MSRDVLAELLAKKTRAEIAAAFGLHANTVYRLIRRYGLPIAPYVQSEETKRLRAASLRRAHQRDPGLAERQTRAIRAHTALIKNKRVEEVYSPEVARAFRARARARALGVAQSQEAREKKRASMLGRTISASARSIVSEKRKKAFRDGSLRLSPRVGHGRGGFRPDLGHYVRSSYEHAFARWLRRRQISYRYEPQTFSVTVDGTPSSLTPDFQVLGVWIEIKNNYNAGLASFLAKLEAFGAEHPQERLVVLVGDGTWVTSDSAIEACVVGQPALAELVAALDGQVLSQQRDLVEPVHKLRPLGVVKG